MSRRTSSDKSRIFYENARFPVERRRANKTYVHVTCVFSVKTGLLLAHGLNERARYTSHNMAYRLHSEQVALAAWHKQNRRVCTKSAIFLVNLALTMSGELRNAAPCDRCCKLIKKASVRYVVWYNGKHVVKQSCELLRGIPSSRDFFKQKGHARAPELPTALGKPVAQVTTRRAKKHVKGNV